MIDPKLVDSQGQQSSTGDELGREDATQPAPLRYRSPSETARVEIGAKESSTLEVDKEQEARSKFAEETHQYVREQIRFADQKATFFFAGATALLAYLHKLGMAAGWVENPRSWGIVQVVELVASLGLSLSAISCIWAVVPRLGGTKRGLIFFAAIREFESPSAYAEEVSRHSPRALCEAKLRHAYELAGVCERKYVALKLGQWLGAVGVVATLVLFLI